ncbi:ATP-binding protein [Hymenobacter cheonanensis]|uniref:ATP-binding protein n=1 Tax=Hymenobacter sp. CA2-7 TaxID=3063993 RepID=UPI002713B81D|nr:ATP-binding protein [Hymenobacter sp. CA2-7]MDO7884228.1 7TM diverse intracellular signaling domain-containing protein [Hymenobacter sp. CA2-7]
MSRILLACWLCLALLPTAGLSQPKPLLPDTLFLRDTTALLPSPALTYYLDPDPGPGSGPGVAALWAAGKFRPMGPARVFQAGFTQDRLWLRAVVANTLAQRTRFVWSLYSFVDSATLFVQPAGRGVPRYAAGTNCRLVATRRPLPARPYCLPFWLNAHERAVLYLCVDNQTGSYYLPTRFASAAGFMTHEYALLFTSHWSWLLGLFGSSVLLNILLFSLLRDPVHLWYAAYVLLGTWFLVMEDSLDGGLLPQGAYGLGWQIGQYGILLLAMACGLRIMALFLRLRQAWPRLHRLSWGLSATAALYVVLYALVVEPARRARARGLLASLHNGREVLLWLVLLGGCFILATVWARGRRPQRQLARLYGFTYLFFIIGTGNFLLNHTGWVNIHLVEPNSLAWGLAAELLTLSILLTIRYRNAQRQNAAWRVRHLRERAAAGQRLIAAQDEEREALARELHDALAPGLTALHLAWQGRSVRQALAQAPPLLAEAHEHTEALLRQLRHDVRTLSQALLPNPPGGEQPPLPEAVVLLTETLSLTDDGPVVACYCDPATASLPVPMQQAAYRIVAELLHNALRHAQAQHVHVEVQRLPASLRLTVRDDGRGFDPRSPAPRRGGLGLRGVQARAGYLRGQVLVSTQPGRGTVITVELPV